LGVKIEEIMMNQTFRVILLSIGMQILLCCPSVLAQEAELMKLKYEQALLQIDNAHKINMADLLEKYNRALQGIANQAQQSGDLDTVVVVRKEKDLYEADAFVYLEDPTVSPSIRKLRLTLYGGVKKHRLEHVSKRSDLASAFGRALDAKIKSLTQSGDLDTALSLKSLKEQSIQDLKSLSSVETESVDGGGIKNPSFNEGLDGWTKSGTINLLKEVSLKTARTQSYAQLMAASSAASLTVKIPQRVIEGGGRLVFKYRYSPDYMGRQSSHSNYSYGMGIGRRKSSRPNVSYSTSLTTLNSRAKKGWLEKRYPLSSTSIAASGYDMIAISTQGTTGSLLIDDVRWE